ncbi:hypothetical protein Mgra_00002647 [Meloidogyne graminicola]|uniref:Uncharacterized protein n=1 Tax=Meloidogyne graminicola TaxID=189291 RepID=A0A8S9ZXQ3_9BILA|nr:hypothetical protein Mgra_00002647 [Meloidogyne graminicola]
MFWLFSLLLILSINVEAFNPSIHQLKEETFNDFKELNFFKNNIKLCEEILISKILKKRSTSSSSSSSSLYNFIRFGRRNSFQINGNTNKKLNNNGNTYDYIRFG